MKRLPIQRPFPVVSVLGSAFLVGYALMVLARPATHAEWFLGDGFLLFIGEFLLFGAWVIGESVLDIRQAIRERTLAPVLRHGSTLLVFAVALIVPFLLFAWSGGNWGFAVFFAVSFVTKAVAWVTGSASKAEIGILGVATIALMIGVTVTAGFWALFIPLPQEVYDALPANQSGVLIDYPETVAVWAILHFTMLALADVFKPAWMGGIYRSSSNEL